MNDYNDKVNNLDNKLTVLNSKTSELEYERICIQMVKRDLMMKNTKDKLSESIKKTYKQFPNMFDGE